MQAAESEQIGSAIVQRDMDLIRNLLRNIERNPKMDRTREFMIQSTDQLELSDQPMDKVAYHLKLLLDAGYIDGSSGGMILRGLTWDGHEFLDNVRSDTIWAKVKTQAATLGTVGMKMLASLAEDEIKKHFGIS
jgi:hypothetical protein